jgi:hypothetical protein
VDWVGFLKLLPSTEQAIPESFIENMVKPHEEVWGMLIWEIIAGRYWHKDCVVRGKIRKGSRSTGVILPDQFSNVFLIGDTPLEFRGIFG